MSPEIAGVLQLLALIAALAPAYRPPGDHMARVHSSEKHYRPEKRIYRAIGANPSAEMRWPAYLRGVLAFSAVSVLFLYALQRAQGILPGSLGFASIDPELVELVEDAKAAVIADNTTAGHTVRPQDVPADAATSSGSGLDPNISTAYAELQVHRVAEQNGLDVQQVEKLVQQHTEGRTLGFMGEPRVNVLRLNTDLKAPARSARPEPAGRVSRRPALHALLTGAAP
ncbi:potassium-transporting ATPase subunit C [Streptomyces avidinii]|nr:potassium-transporting ATPase subunit C [Streptomyces avidinii]